MNLHREYFLLFIIVLFNCCNKEKNHQVQVVTVNHKENSTINASSFIKNYKIIRLSTGTDNLIYQISKVQYVNNKVYILDIPGNSVYIYDNKGNLIDKLKKIGNGPGEYIQITDFFVDNDFLYVMDFTRRAIMKYNNNLDFVEKINYKSFGSKFILQDSNCWIYNEPSGEKIDYQFSLLNKKGELKSELIKRNSGKNLYNWTGANVFCLDTQDYFLSPRYSDTIYKAKNGAVYPEFILNFKKHNFPQKENINSYDITNSDFPYLIKHNFYISKKYLIFDYVSNMERFYCIHDREREVGVTGKIVNDLIDNFRFFPRWGNNNFLIEEISPEVLLNHFNNSVLLKNFSNIEEDDNPLIIIYELKK